LLLWDLLYGPMMSCLSFHELLDHIGLLPSQSLWVHAQRTQPTDLFFVIVIDGLS